MSWPEVAVPVLDVDGAREARRLAAVGRMFAEQVHNGVCTDSFPWTLIEHYHVAGRHWEGQTLSLAYVRHSEALVTHDHLVAAGWAMCGLRVTDEWQLALMSWF